MNFSNKNCLLFGILLLQSLSYVTSSNILGLFLTHSPSHVIVHMGVVRALVDRGHNVTVVTSMKINEPNFGYRHIYLKTLEHTQNDTYAMMQPVVQAPFYLKMVRLTQAALKMVDKYNKYNLDPDYIKFKSENNHFDLVLLGYQYNEANLGEAAFFKCPSVAIFMMQPFGHVSRLVGNPNLPAFVPYSPFIPPTAMDFKYRVLNYIFYVVERLFVKLVDIYMTMLYEEMYPSPEYPSYQEVRKNISIMFYNHHFSEGPVRPLVPSLIEIGGIQIKEKPDPLPKDIQAFLDAAPQGSIFFSLGSNACGLHVKEKTINMIFDVLASLKYNVLWKLDDIKQPGTAPNIMFKKWVPQNDVLAHKNLKLFITHAGKGSVTESEYHQVPMIALPISDDQPSNAAIMESKGHGVVLDHETMTEKMFRKTVLEVMENKKYRDAVEKFSKVYKDRPMTAKETAAFWVEYVIRHRGAPHMQSPLKDLNVFQESSLDVISFLVVVLYLAWKLLKIIIKLFLKLLRRLVLRQQKKVNSKQD